MYITPILNNNIVKHNSNNKINKQNSVNFTGVSLKTLPAGRLEFKTTQKINNILYAYEDIISKLALKSEEGIKFVTENFPVTIKDCIIFHNCGQNNNSIAIKVGGKNFKNLMHIVRRKGNSTWSEKIVEEAYMIENASRLLSDFKTNHMRIFPEERKYFSQEEIVNNDDDKNLQQLMDDLDPVLLKFRIFLLKNADKYVKAPDGKIPYSIMEEIRSTEKLIEEARSASKKIPKMQLYKLLDEQHKEYIPLSGNSTYSFKNLGEEKLTISFAPVLSQYHEDLKRLSVYNEDGSLKRVFMFQDNKMVKNTSPNNPNYLAEKFEFYDEKEILSDSVSGEFSKYLNLYKKAVLKLQAIVTQRVKAIESKFVEGSLEANVKENLETASKMFEKIQDLYSKASNVDKGVVKSELAKENIEFNLRGITFSTKEGFKEVYFQPVKSNFHSNLLKLFITDKATEEREYYLVHNNEKIVKSFWANSPNIIPQTLKYLEEARMPDLSAISKETSDLLVKLKTRIEEILEREKATRIQNKEIARFEVANVANSRKISRAEKSKVSKEKNNIDLELSEEHKKLIKSCRAQLTNALKNLDEGLEGFNKSLQEIQQKVVDFYNKNKQN